jgi:hypothetical protein
MTPAGELAAVADSLVCRTPTLASIPGSAQTSLDCTRDDLRYAGPLTRFSWVWGHKRWSYAGYLQDRWPFSNGSTALAPVASSRRWRPVSATLRTSSRNC